jgi:Ca2+/H+ antiporter, TMEM165/GDT1 family
VLFAVGAVLLLRGSEDEVVPPAESGPGWRRAVTSFGVIFAAEWGDASQLATAALTARYADTVAVFAGSFVALVGLAAVAVSIGRVVTRQVSLHLIQRAAGILFVVFAVVATVEAIRG